MSSSLLLSCNTQHHKCTDPGSKPHIVLYTELPAGKILWKNHKPGLKGIIHNFDRSHKIHPNIHRPCTQNCSMNWLGNSACIILMLSWKLCCLGKVDKHYWRKDPNMCKFHWSRLNLFCMLVQYSSLMYCCMNNWGDRYRIRLLFSKIPHYIHTYRWVCVYFLCIQQYNFEADCCTQCPWGILNNFPK